MSLFLGRVVIIFGVVIYVKIISGSIIIVVFKLLVILGGKIISSNIVFGRYI